MISLVTSLVGGGPLGGVTCGSLDSGPLVGVFAAAVLGPVGPVAALEVLGQRFVGLVLVADGDRAGAAGAAAAGDQGRGAERREAEAERRVRAR